MTQHFKVVSGGQEELEASAPWLQTACRVTFRSGTVTRQGTVRCEDERVIRRVSRLLPLAWRDSPLLRKGCSGSGWRDKGGVEQQLTITAVDMWVIM